MSTSTCIRITRYGFGEWPTEKKIRELLDDSSIEVFDPYTNVYTDQGFSIAWNSKWSSENVRGFAADFSAEFAARVKIDEEWDDEGPGAERHIYLDGELEHRYEMRLVEVDADGKVVPE